MTELLAAIGGGGTVALAIALVVMAFRLSSAKDGQIASDKEALAQKERANAAVNERDSLTVQLAAMRATNADNVLAKSMIESERNALVKKLADAERKLLAATPVGDEGAKVVNDMFATPIGESGPDGLEKP